MNEKLEKIGFFKRVWYAITKIEKYPEMSSHGLRKSIGYLAKVVLMITIILCVGILYQTHNLIQEGVQYLKSEFPEFAYQEGILKVEKEEQIVVEDTILGKVIIDTNTQEETKMNQYINSLAEEGKGIIILKDKLMIKNLSMTGTISYSYQDIFNPLGVREFNKQAVIDYATGTGVIPFYISVFLTFLIYEFFMYFIIILSNVILLSIFGYITTVLARIKMRYVAIFNMSIYALTLSVFLNMLYIGINIFVPFTMEYFQVMYVAVAAIYLVAAILILKTEVMKQQIELMKIMQTEEVIKQQMAEKERKEKEEKEKEEQRKKEKEGEKSKKKKQEEEKEEEGHRGGEEPEGSNA